MFKPIHAQISYWAQKCPSSMAVTDGTTSLTYERLDCLSSKLARLLHDVHHLGPGSLTVVLVQNAVSSIVALIAVLKTGAAYLPLDRTYPPKRRQMILSESEASLVIVTDKDDAGIATGIPSFHLELAEVAKLDPSDLSVDTDRHAVAYVIYTSGSTGKPKGVVVEHEALANNIEWAANYYRKADDELHSLLNTSLSFDGSATTCWAPLTSGGSVTLVNPSDIDGLLKWVAYDDRINVFKVTPSSLTALLDLGIRFRNLRVLIVAGEAFRTELARRAYSILGPRVAIFNSYGPSEATINCMVHQWTGNESATVVPIGTPIPGCFAVVVDESGRRLIGQAGQLVVGGRCLARGYHRAPELTAEKFKEPGEIHGERVYFTGDRVLEDAIGIFHFLGRIDLQRKLRGYRIDLGEVEQALMEEGCFEDVVAEVEGTDPSWLVASVVLKPYARLDLPQLQRRLREVLPESMVPQRWFRLDRMPVDSHGKKDRTAVSLSRRSLFSLRPIQPPQTATEHMIASLLRDLLGREVPSITTSLDELGIDSIRRMMLVARVANRTGKRLAPSQIHADATLAQIARTVDDFTANSAALSLPIEARLPDGEPIPFILAQQSYFDYLQRQRARHHHETFENLYFAGVLRGEPNQQALVKAVDALVDRHELLRSVPETGPDGTMVFTEMRERRPSLDILGFAEEATDRHSEAFQQAVTTIVLRSGSPLIGQPLFRAVLARVNGTEHVLILVGHILICDGWSKNLLLRELGALYASFCDKQDITLPPLAIRWRDYAAWERQRLALGSFESHLRYWCEHLQNSRALGLPEIASAGSEQESATLALPEEACTQMTRLIARQGGGKFAFFIHCLAVQLFFYTGCRDLVIGVLGANRPYLELEAIIGPFVTVLFLRFQIDPQSSFRRDWQQAIAVCEDALDHQDIPLPIVSQALSARGTTSVTQTRLRFNLGNHPRSELLLKGLTIQPIQARHRHNDTSGKFKFDVMAETKPYRVSLRYDGLAHSHRILFLEDYSRLLRAAAAAPDQPVASFVHLVEGTWRA